MLVCLLVEVDMLSGFPNYGLAKKKKTIFFDIKVTAHTWAIFFSEK